MITQTALKEFVRYDAETGRFIRARNSTKGKAKAGDTCGYQEATGYLAFSVKGKKYLAHRLAWLYMTGEWPRGQIDHIDGNRTNNSWRNLRDVTNGQNQQNLRTAKSHNKCGFLGVSKNKSRWKAEIRTNGLRTHIGTYDTPQEAHKAYLSAKSQMHIGADS